MHVISLNWKMNVMLELVDTGIVELV